MQRTLGHDDLLASAGTLLPTRVAYGPQPQPHYIPPQSQQHANGQQFPYAPSAQQGAWGAPYGAPSQPAPGAPQAWVPANAGAVHVAQSAGTSSPYAALPDKA